MSEKEFEQKDNELFKMVNGQGAGKQPGKFATKKQTEAERCREGLWLALKVFTCGLIAMTFLMAMLDPDWVPVLSYSGMAVCLIVATVMVDGYIRKLAHG